MRRLVCTVLMVGAVMFFFSSCTLIPRASHPSGDLRLLSMHMSESAEEGVPYDVTVVFEAGGDPQITRACFHWLNDRTSLRSPTLYSYTTDVQNNRQIGASDSRWLSEGSYTRLSPVFCYSDIGSMRRGKPGSFNVKLLSSDIKSYYNKLQCYVEYLQDGELKQSNKVSADALILDENP